MRKSSGRFKYYGTPQRNNQQGSRRSSNVESTEVEEPVSRWKIGVVLCAIGILMFALFPLAKDSEWYGEHWIAYSFVYSLLAVTVSGVGLFQFTKELSYAASTIRIIENSVLLLTTFGIIIMSFVFAAIASHKNADLLEKYGVTTIGYISSMSDETSKGKTTYKIEYRFYTNNSREMFATTIVDEVTYKNYSLYDEIGVRYLPTKPEISQAFFSNSGGTNISAFPSRSFSPEDIYLLGKFISDTAGVTKYLRNIEFGFEQPKLVDNITWVAFNKHRYQRVTIKKDNYVEYVGMYEGLDPVFSLKSDTKFKRLEIDSTIGDFAYQRENRVVAVKNMNESIALFYHFRVYYLDSIRDTDYTAPPYMELQGAREYMFLEIK